MRGVIGAILLASGLAAISPASAADSPPTRTVAASGDTHVLAGPVRVDLATRPATPAEKAPSRATRCSGGWTECSLVDSLTIRVDGKDVAVPARAVVLLSDVASARVSRLAADRFALILTGGDAGASHEARLIFDRHMVRRTEIWHGETKVMEQATDYHDIAEESSRS